MPVEVPVRIRAPVRGVIIRPVLLLSKKAVVIKCEI